MSIVASNDPRIMTVEVVCTEDLIIAHLADGRTVSEKVYETSPGSRWRGHGVYPMRRQRNVSTLKLSGQGKGSTGRILMRTSATLGMLTGVPAPPSKHKAIVKVYIRMVEHRLSLTPSSSLSAMAPLTQLRQIWWRRIGTNRLTDDQLPYI